MFIKIRLGLYKRENNMALSPKTVKIRQQIINEVRSGNISPVADIMALFDLTRPAVMRHINALIEQHKLQATGSTKDRVYTLGTFREQVFSFVIEKGKSSEHSIFRNHFGWVLEEDLPDNIVDIVFHGFTEMVNNVIDHSEGIVCKIKVSRDSETISIFIFDDGEGIFKRVTRLCDLIDEHQAIIELKKGKLTTDPDNHSGQGIFFTSRMFDDFVIESRGLRFEGHNKDYDLLSDISDNGCGTRLGMRVKLDSKRTCQEVFSKYSGDGENDYPFNKTVIPVELAQFGNQRLVSRSQAKTLLARIESFETVIFDFTNVDSIGQAFADEIFRVKARSVPNIAFHICNANEMVMNMINRAKND